MTQETLSANDSFFAAVDIGFGAPGTGSENRGTANGPAAVGESRYFKFRVTAPGLVGIFLGHSSSGFDAGPITLYNGDHAPIPTPADGSGYYGPLDTGLYYLSFKVTGTQAGDFPGTNEYQLQVVGNSPSATSAPGPLASLASADVQQA